MSGVIAWLTGFLDGSTGKYTFRSTTFRSDTFASGCWTGVGTYLVRQRDRRYPRAVRGHGVRSAITGDARRTGRAVSVGDSKRMQRHGHY